MQSVGIGIIGCGNISGAYLKAARLFPVLDIRAVADLDPAAAAARGEEFGVPATGVEELLADPAIEIVAEPDGAEARTSRSGRRLIAAGKHVYSEKPLGVALRRGGGSCVGEAARRGLRVGCAPDTFLGGAHQTARELIDAGRDRRAGRRHAPSSCAPATSAGIRTRTSTTRPAAGRCSTWGPTTSPTSSTCSGRWRGSRRWRRRRGRAHRSPASRAHGETIAGRGADACRRHARVRRPARSCSIAMSFDVPAHRHLPIEIYGTEGSADRARPELVRRRGRVRWPRAASGRRCRSTGRWTDGNYRSLGARRHGGGDPRRAGRTARRGELALHVLEVMEAIRALGRERPVRRDRHAGRSGRAPLAGDASR